MTVRGYLELDSEEVSLVHSALEYMRENYDLYKAEEIKEPIDKLRLKISDQWHKQICNKPDFAFTCRKCGHNLFAQSIATVKKLDKIDCPSCGEEGYENWIFSRIGNYDKEYRNK